MSEKVGDNEVGKWMKRVAAGLCGGNVYLSKGRVMH